MADHRTPADLLVCSGQGNTAEDRLPRHVAQKARPDLFCKQGVVGSSPITSTTSVMEMVGAWIGSRRVCIAEKRQQFGVLVSYWNLDAGGVSEWRRCSLGDCRTSSGVTEGRSLAM